MKTNKDLVRELADREAIRDLSAHYCDCIWRKDLDGLVNLFADDGAFIVEGLEVEAVAKGHVQLKKVYEKAIAETNPRLFIHSHIIDLTGTDRAKGRCYVEVYSAAFGMRRVGLGYYEDEYSKIDDNWKFASRRYFLEEIDTAVSLRKTFMV
jgi:ketosteroid isomerase-like protein